ncbi:anti-sigma factor [Agrilutibacter solisilvae]|uniref:Anti-sigma factor n=1 Tax=Agrilutibacter solisilvae TaxID=2763317 RepID=A0A974XXP5_9GAMM|nr:anti-sigma factor [Lysobacter solisilvae]QSX77702.1 anti-sigma factor [Lysobacter solisilvae]
MNTTRGPSDDDTHGPAPDDDLQAAEYVLGVQDRAERHRVQLRLADEPAFAARVLAWEARLSPWLLRIEPATPSPHVWPRIRTRLGWPAVGTKARPGVWNDLRFWRGAAGLAAAAGVAAIVFALRVPAPAPAPPVVVTPPPVVQPAVPLPVTVLARDDGSTGWIASIDKTAGVLKLVPVPAPADSAGRVNELWIIPAGAAPISLGLLSHEMSHEVELPAAARSALQAGATLAVTLEPAAGIPHAAPSGPIVAKGTIGNI